MITRAFAYKRISGKGQLQGTGLDRQHETVYGFAQQNGYEIVNVYEDVYTGTDADRPAFMEMLEAMLSNGVKTVIVESLDRLARDILVQSSLLAKLASEGLTLISATTGENVTASMEEDPMRRALVQIQGVFAELDRRLLVRKLRKGREIVKARKGRCEGDKPFGSKEGEDVALERLRQLIDAGYGNVEIAATLNAEGVPSRSGRPWNRGTVWKIAKDLAAAA